jgi:hypothetical protein
MKLTTCDDISTSVYDFVVLHWWLILIFCSLFTVMDAGQPAPPLGIAVIIL